jgi:beta-lactam-binding protein with PASTA domain
LIVVPEVRGWEPAQAESILSLAHLGASDQLVPAGDRFGKVIGSDPSVGSRVDRNATVTLKIGAFELGDLVGRTKWDVEKMLRSAGITVQWMDPQVTSTKSKQIPPGTIIFQDPAPGKLLTNGSNVALRVEDDWSKVPGVRGKMLDDALNIIRSAQLEVDWSFVAPTPQTFGWEEFRVLNQDPAEDEIVKKRTKVHLVCQGR